MKNKILIVEDDPDIDCMLSLAISWLVGAETITRHATTELKQAIEESRPTIVLLDTSLPNAVAEVKARKADPATQDVPIVGINSRGLMTCAEAVREGFDACCDAGEIDDVVATIRRFLLPAVEG